MSYRRIGALCCSAAGSVLHAAGRPGGYGAGAPPGSHSELGRESLQRRWYFVLRHGRVGRCLVFQLHEAHSA